MPRLMDTMFAVIAINFARAFGAPAIRRVGFLSALGGISGDAATIALARRCAALPFIINSTHKRPLCGHCAPVLAVNPANRAAPAACALGDLHSKLNAQTSTLWTLT